MQVGSSPALAAKKVLKKFLKLVIICRGFKMEEINGWKLKEGSNKTYTKNGITAVIFEDKICFGRNGAKISEYEIKTFDEAVKILKTK